MFLLGCEMKEPSLIIKEIRDDAGLSISEFARQVGTHRQTIQDIESGKRKKIPQEIALKIQEKYSVFMVYLMTGEGEKYAKADKVTETAANYGAGILERMAQSESEMKANIKLLIDLAMTSSLELKELRQEVKELKAGKSKGAEIDFVPQNNGIGQKNTARGSA